MHRGYISFFVPGVPAPQGSKSFKGMSKRGRPIMVESAGERLTSWRSMVTITAALEERVTDDAVSVTLEFAMPRPAAARRRKFPHVRPDLDKLVRATLDGLTDAGTYRDDAAVCRLLAVKRYESPTGCHVTVMAMPGL